MLFAKLTNTFLGRAYLTATQYSTLWIFPAWMLFIRLWMAKIFWYSGLTKLSSWASTLYLFQYEYKVPVISPIIAAYMSTSVELICPILLLLGFAARFAVLPMLAMTAVIQFTYENSSEHIYWALLLGTILFYGAGKISIDNWIKQKVSS